MASEDSRAPQGDQTYAVQRAYMVPSISGTERAEGGEMQAWVDVATVTVPPRTIRNTVVKRAFEQAGITVPVGERYDVRVLDADSARVIPVGSKQPPPELVIGDVA